MRRFALALFLAAPLCAQHGVGGLSNPYASEEDVQLGSQIYALRCALCHGPQGEGGRGSDLTQGRYRRGSSDQEMFAVISDGVPGTEMPGIDLDAPSIWRLVAFVRTLSAGRGAEQASGDAARGREVFVANGCLNCHRVGREGSRTAPDLSRIGAERSLGHMEAAVLDPGSTVRPEHWFVDARTKSGRQVRGRRLNEDTVSVQLLDTEQRLVSLMKDDIESYRVVKTSTMPSYRDKLSAADLEDLIAYLASLR